VEKVKIVTLNPKTGEVTEGVSEKIAATENIWRANPLYPLHLDGCDNTILSGVIDGDNFIEPLYKHTEDSNSGTLVFVTSAAEYHIKGTRQTKTFGSAVFLTAQRGCNEFSVGRWKVSLDPKREFGIAVSSAK
jgi:hypothetical protein